MTTSRAPAARRVILSHEVVVTDAPVEPGQQRSRFICDDGFLKVGSGKFSNRIERPPPRNNDEFGCPGVVSLKEHCARISVHLSHRRQHVGPQVVRVGLDLRRRRLRRPDTGDHRSPPSGVALKGSLPMTTVQARTSHRVTSPLIT